MTFAWALPAALALTGLAALPIAAHFTRRPPIRRIQFGAMLLVRRLERRIRRRRRLSDLPLLLARLLIVGMLALAATGPELIIPGGSTDLGGTGRVILVIDRSMSMSLQDRGATLLSRAIAGAQEAIERTSPSAKVAIIAYDDEAVIVSPLTSKDAAAERLAAVTASEGSSDLRAALVEVRRMLASEPGEVVIFTDEAGPTMVPEAREDLARLTERGAIVIPNVIHAAPPRNLAVSAASYGDGLEGGSVAFTVENFGPDPVEAPCAVRLPDGTNIRVFVTVPAGGKGSSRVTVPRKADGGVGEVRCEDPDLALDDAWFFHLPRVGASRVLVVDGQPGDTPVRSEVYFLERALAPWGDTRGTIAPDVVPPVGLGSVDPSTHRVVFLANVADPRPFASRLTDFVQQGGALVIGVGDNVTPDRYAALTDLLPAKLTGGRALADYEEPGVPLTLPDVRHPLFSMFASSGRASFGRVRTHRVIELAPFTEGPELEVLLRYEGGMPAMVSRRVGAGRVVLWTSTFDLAWTNLAHQASFMPLVQRLAGWLGGESGGVVDRVDGRVGEPIRWTLPEGITDVEVYGPDGELVPAELTTSELSFTPRKAGAWQVRAPNATDSAPPIAWVAVNRLLTESDVRRGPELAAQPELDPARFQLKYDLDPWLIAAALALMAAVAFSGAQEEPTAPAGEDVA